MDLLMIPVDAIGIAILWLRVKMKHEPEIFLANAAVLTGVVLVLAAFPHVVVTAIAWPKRLTKIVSQIVDGLWKIESQKKHDGCVRKSIKTAKDLREMAAMVRQAVDERQTQRR